MAYTLYTSRTHRRMCTPGCCSRASFKDHLRPLPSTADTEFSVLTAFRALSLLLFPLLHFPLPHFQRPPFLILSSPCRASIAANVYFMGRNWQTTHVRITLLGELYGRATGRIDVKRFQ